MNWLTKKVNLNIKTTLGMFNLAKGVLILLVIVSHSMTFHGIIDLDFFKHTIPGFLLRMNQEAINFGVNACFFMIIGYGFRKVSMKKCAQQLKVPLIMYALTAAATAMCRIIHTAVTHTTETGSLMTDLVQELLPFLLGMSPGSDNFFGIQVKAVGIAWFLITYLSASLLFNAVLSIKKERIQWIVVFALSTVSICLSSLKVPFCLLQAMIACGYMFAGYQMKKKKVFQKGIPVYVILLMVVIWFVSLKGGGTNLSMNKWYRGLPDLASCYAAGLIFMAVLVKLDRVKGWFSDKLRWIGSNSLIIFCTHTISYKIMYWYGVRKKFQDAVLLEALLEILFHCVFCFGVCFLILQIMKKRSEMRSSKE